MAAVACTQPWRCPTACCSWRLSRVVDATHQCPVVCVEMSTPLPCGVHGMTHTSLASNIPRATCIVLSSTSTLFSKHCNFLSSLLCIHKAMMLSS
jgi:hypothetical protein